MNLSSTDSSVLIMTNGGAETCMEVSAMCFDSVAYTVTAANPHESSYACYHASKLKTFLRNEFNVNWMENVDSVRNIKFLIIMIMYGGEKVHSTMEEIVCKALTGEEEKADYILGKPAMQGSQLSLLQTCSEELL